jgi:bifunctional non-homologous end joining protein LigD
MRRDIFDALLLIEGPALSVVGMPKSEAKVIRWVEPRLVADVAYAEITPDGQARHPSFKGIRVRPDA